MIREREGMDNQEQVVLIILGHLLDDRPGISAIGAEGIKEGLEKEGRGGGVQEGVEDETVVASRNGERECPIHHHDKEQ